MTLWIVPGHKLVWWLALTVRHITPEAFVTHHVNTWKKGKKYRRGFIDGLVLLLTSNAFDALAFWAPVNQWIKCLTSHRPRLTHHVKTWKKGKKYIKGGLMVWYYFETLNHFDALAFWAQVPYLSSTKIMFSPKFILLQWNNFLEFSRYLKNCLSFFAAWNLYLQTWMKTIMLHVDEITFPRTRIMLSANIFRVSYCSIILQMQNYPLDI